MIEVPSTRIKGAKIAICGESPGKEEEAEGRGFVGPAGKTLDKILVAGGVRREECGIYNVVNHAPDWGYDSEHFRSTFYHSVIPIIATLRVLKRCVHCGGTEKRHNSKKNVCPQFKARTKVTLKKGKKRVEPTEELLRQRLRLKAELEEDRPNVVLACGAEALRALVTSAGSISNERGSVLESTLIPGLKVIPILHPSAILRGAQWQELYIAGCVVRKKVVPESKSPALERTPWITLEPNLETIRRVAGGIATGGNDLPFWTLDIETRGEGIACIGVGYVDRDEEYALCIPIQTTAGPYWSLADEMEIWCCIQRMMDNPRLIGQNLLFDLDWLLDYGLLPSGVLLDTMLGFHAMYPELPKGLAFLTMWYTDIPYYKDEGKTWGSRTPDEDLWDYNVKDLAAQLRVAKVILRELWEKDLWRSYRDFTNAQIPIALEMQYRGFDVGMNARGEARGIVAQERDVVHKRLIGEIGVEFDSSSPKQVQHVLYDVLKLPYKFNPKTKRLTSDEDAILELASQFPEHKGLRLILAERHLDKARDSYINAPLMNQREKGS